MISPETLRRYSYFAGLADPELKAIAMISEEIEAKDGDVLCEPETPATFLYLLLSGSAEVIYKVVDRDDPHLIKEFYLGEIAPGDVFGISAVVEPYRYTTKVKVTAASTIAKIEGPALRALCEVDTKMAYSVMRQTAITTMERLHQTRILLAAARG